MEDDEHMQTTPAVGNYVKVLHLSHLRLDCILLVKSKYKTQTMSNLTALSKNYMILELQRLIK